MMEINLAKFSRKFYEHAADNKKLFERAFSAYCQRNADTVTAAHHKGYRRGLHAGDKFRKGKPSLHIAADGIKDNYQPLDASVLLDSHKSGYDMLILCGLVLLVEDVMPLDLPDYIKAVDKVAGVLGRCIAVILRYDLVIV